MSGAEVRLYIPHDGDVSFEAWRSSKAPIAVKTNPSCSSDRNNYLPFRIQGTVRPSTLRLNLSSSLQQHTQTSGRGSQSTPQVIKNDLGEYSRHRHVLHSPREMVKEATRPATKKTTTHPGLQNDLALDRGAEGGRAALLLLPQSRPTIKETFACVLCRPTVTMCSAECRVLPC